MRAWFDRLPVACHPAAGQVPALLGPPRHAKHLLQPGLLHPTGGPARSHDPCSSQARATAFTTAFVKDRQCRRDPGTIVVHCCLRRPSGTTLIAICRQLWRSSIPAAADRLQNRRGSSRELTPMRQRGSPTHRNGGVARSRRSVSWEQRHRRAPTTLVSVVRPGCLDRGTVRA